MADSVKRRVVVTGMGAITPCGLNPQEFWQAMIEGRSGVGHITYFDTSNQTCSIAAEVKGFKAEDFIDKKDARRMDRFMQFAMAAARQAYEDSGLNAANINPERFSVIVGTGTGSLSSIESQHIEIMEKGPKRCTPFLIPMIIPDMAAGRISMAYNAQGPNMAVVTACATGTDSIGNAVRMIQYGETDVCIAGGAESAITPMSVAGFASARALSFRNDDPQGASRPFDKGRDGFVMGEGSCLLVVEELSHALKRGAKIYGEIAGYGRTSDAYDIVSPSPDGSGATKAMRFAMRDAGVSPEQIGYLNAHATSTPVGDVAETNAIKSVFGEHATSGKLLVSSTKSMTGHMLGSAGSAEAIISLLALRDQIIPPTINITDPDPECDLDVVPNTARKVSGMTYSLSNSFGFGGHNASLIFKLLNVDEEKAALN